MAENRRAMQQRLERRKFGREVKSWRIVVYSGGAIALDRTVDSKAAARKLWEKYRESECWVECYADGRKLRWIESERLLMGYVHYRFVNTGGNSR